MGIAVLLAALALSPVSFLQSQNANGAYANDPILTAWAVLGLRAAGAESPGSLAYLQAHESELVTSNDIAIVALAEQALGADTGALTSRLKVRASGQIGETLNSTFWGVLALHRASAATKRFLLAHQARNGGFAWSLNGTPDSNDTAAALEAFRVAGIRGAPVTRAVRYLRTFRNRDGGFELSDGRGSDAQSTAWAIQGLVAAGERPPRSAFAYLAKLKRADGSYRYSARYVTTPLWVTSQVLAALAKRPFPL